jgi:hypothetical protein
MSLIDYWKLTRRKLGQTPPNKGPDKDELRAMPGNEEAHESNEAMEQWNAEERSLYLMAGKLIEAERLKGSLANFVLVSKDDGSILEVRDLDVDIIGAMTGLIEGEEIVKFAAKLSGLAEVDVLLHVTVFVSMENFQIEGVNCALLSSWFCGLFRGAQVAAIKQEPLDDTSSTVWGTLDIDVLQAVGVRTVGVDLLEKS